MRSEVRDTVLVFIPKRTRLNVGTSKILIKKKQTSWGLQQHSRWAAPMCFPDIHQSWIKSRRQSVFAVNADVWIKTSFSCRQVQWVDWHLQHTSQVSDISQGQCEEIPYHFDFNRHKHTFITYMYLYSVVPNKALAWACYESTLAWACHAWAFWFIFQCPRLQGFVYFSTTRKRNFNEGKTFLLMTTYEVTTSRHV